MGLKGHDTRNIFPDFRTYVYPPVSPAWFDPKSWGTGTTWWAFDGILLDLNGSFVDDDVQNGDAAYIISPVPAQAIVVLVLENTAVVLAPKPIADRAAPLYKIGHGPHHTIPSLSSIVGARAATYYTVHHSKLWTGAQRPHWNTDETGEVYVISHDTGKALWLDGVIDLPMGFPDNTARPPEPLPIDLWESRFPERPRPDYPVGLEPGGTVRSALIAEFGSLLEAHDAKKGIPT